ncbi:GGDEF domain-containing protein [Amycolatopsis sp. NPDC059021]|uniref:GGDEF domain-containing protein n=1 Tax=Amycolatopsis sp. NPDC059021 TaxID=3346704 RepID=UPI0036707700
MVFIELLALAAVALGAVLVPATGKDLLEGGVVIGLGVLAAEMANEVERRRRRFSDTPHVNFSSVWTLAGALVLPPALAAVVAVVLYAHLWVRCWRGVPGLYVSRTAFNVSNVIVSTQAAAWAVRELDIVSGALDRGVLGAAGVLAIIALYYVVNSAIAAITIALAGADRTARRLLGRLNENILELATLCLGAATALLLAWHPWLALLMLLPLYALHRSALIRQFEHAATTDSKTSLLNAASWRAIAQAELDRARQHGTTAAILMIDIDHFRKVNNTYGHLAGDDALRALGETLRAMVRSNDLCGRFGGEEFVVVLPGCASADDVLAVANRIRERIASTPVTAQSTGATFSVTVSIGAAYFPATGMSLDELLLAADNALYGAKDAGRNQARVVEAT